MFNEALEALEKNKEFNDWKSTHDKAYLANFFLLKERKEVKLAYFNPENNKFTTFIPKPFEILPEDDVLADAIPQQLDMHKVHLPLSKAMDIAEKELNKKGTQIVNQTVAILQCLQVPLYNITFVTMTFNIVNIRIDASSGELIKSAVSNLMDFGNMS